MSTTAKVEGVASTIRELRQIEPKLAREAINTIKAPTGPAVSDVRATAPAAPLSGMGGYGPTKAAAKYGGRAGSDGTRPLVRIQLKGPGWTTASDMARQSSPGESMTPNLLRKYGPASRWVWPTVERHMPAMIAAITDACRAVERQTTQALKGS